MVVRMSPAEKPDERGQRVSDARIAAQIDAYQDPFAIAARDARATIAALRKGYSKDNDDISQTLGQALGYPRYADDQKTFPGATGEDVCIGEHVAASIAAEAARKIVEQAAEIERLRTEVAEANRFVKYRTRQLELAHRYWLRDAKEALAGKPHSLCIRVAMAEAAPEFNIVLSEDQSRALTPPAAADGGRDG